MSEALRSILQALADNPFLQGLAAGLATFILEDPTTIGCGLLVAEGHMTFMTALIGVALGIGIGDVGLYGLGRLAGPWVRGRGPLTEERLSTATAWFDRNLVAAIVVSRFVPGMRLPTYVGAGMLRARFWTFAVVAMLASVVWTSLLLVLTVELGEAVLPLLGHYRWPVALTALLALVLLQRRAARRMSRAPVDGRVLSSFELWPPWIFYIPVAGYWLWLSIRHRGWLLPTVANPSIFSGGFIGESKTAILDLIPERQQQWVAEYACLERSAAATEDDADAALDLLRSRNLGFPVVAKPDLGQRGDGVRPIRSRSELEDYLHDFPKGSRIVFQRMIPPPETDLHPESMREAGVLYWRRPSSSRGRIFSITLKIFPELTGDGSSSVAQLIDANPRARHLAELYRRRHQASLDRILDEGERFPLVFSGNHCQGTIFKNGTQLATPALEDRIESIAQSIPDFFFGRFDIRFSDFDEFLAGRGFKIIEINGASAEATHIWDAETSLGEAYRVLFEQFSTLFAIGAENRRSGHRPMSMLQFLKTFWKYRRLAKSYPTTL